MKIQAADVFRVTLPFRFAFGHSLASRASSTNLIVRVRLEDGTVGFGEGIPRDYVTGESLDGAAEAVSKLYAPRLLNLNVSSPGAVLSFLAHMFEDLGLGSKPRGASWCALELAVLDAVARAHRMSVATWLGPVQLAPARYGAVVPFAGPKALTAILLFYKLYGFETIKLKVGSNLQDDLARLRLTRQVMGPEAILRVDANCAWNVDQALRAAERFRTLGVVSIEQPLPADDFEGLARLTASIPEEVVVDESLCTLAQAEVLAASRACGGFNIRLSKVGGILAARRMVALARQHGIRCHMGAQVGESGILSAAGRTLACVEGPFENLEGSDNRFLLKEDLTRENLTVGFRGYGKLLAGEGFGVTVLSEKLANFGLVCPSPANRPGKAISSTAARARQGEAN